MTRFKQIVIYFLVAVVSALLLFGISRVENSMDIQVKEHHLRFEGDVNSAPPLVAITTMALGSFRGLLADVLWIRANNLKDEGNYVETVQLANWITDLQPTFSGMTVYLAWDMSYNISVTCARKEDRWIWVQEGIKLIRDKALAYNPEDPKLYAELAYTFMHKMGHIMDDANQYYKTQWGLAINRIIGERPDWSFYLNRPIGLDAFSKRWDRENVIWTFDPSIKDFQQLLNTYIALNGMPESFRNKLSAAELEELDWTLRANWLNKETRMVPEVIVEINETYGEFDWRTMEVQCIYWATMALKKTPGHKDLQCERLISQSLAMSVLNGRFVYLGDDMVFVRGNTEQARALNERAKAEFERVIQIPNLGLAPAALRTYNAAYEENDAKSFLSARQNFYKDVIVLLYCYGQQEVAKDYYEAYKKDQLAIWEMNEIKPEKFPPFEKFAKDEWEEDIASASYMRLSGLIFSRLFEMYRFLSIGDLETARRLQEQALFIYNDYTENRVGDNEKLSQRTGLAPFDQYLQTSYIVLAGMLTPAEKAQLDANIAEIVRQEEQARKEAADAAAAEAARQTKLR